MQAPLYAAYSPEELAERQILITRNLDAEPDRVFTALLDGEHLHQWWGPEGFTTTTISFDGRAGGQWLYTMHSPDGTDYPNRMSYLEVEAPEHLSYILDNGQDEDPDRFEVAVTIHRLAGGGAQVTMHLVFANSVIKEQNLKAGAVEGGYQMLERLNQHLAGTAGIADQPDYPFTISRTLDAPQSLVWAAWTESAHLEKWWGPKGTALGVERLDLRPGGHFHYRITTPDGKLMYGVFAYEQVQAPKRLVFISSFADAQAKIIRHPMAENWPLETRSTLTLAEQNGQTLLTLSGGPIRATEAEQKMYIDSLEPLRQGFTGTLDQLEAYLAKVGS